jgi:hypothetical protein
MFAMFVLCLWSVPAKATPVTTIYEFVRDASTVVKTIWPFSSKTYYIDGQFQMIVDYDAGIALFHEVDATLSGEILYYDYDAADFLFTDNLDVLFELTELESVYVSDTKIDFLLERNIPTFPASDIHLTVRFGFMGVDSLLQMTGALGAPVYDGPWYNLNAVAVVVPEPATLLIMVVGGMMLRRRS